MDTYEAKKLLADSLRCLTRSMDQIRLRELEKVMGDDEPMQDHLAQCTNYTPYEHSSVKDCCDYLLRLYKGFKEASDHEILMERKFGLAELEVGHVCDLIMGYIGHGFPDELVACAREVPGVAKELLPTGRSVFRSKDAYKKSLGLFFDRILPITKKHGYDITKDKSYSLPVGYLASWFERQYWEK